MSLLKLYSGVRAYTSDNALSVKWYCAPHMYAGRNYGNVNISKAAGGYWKEEEDIREYATLYSPLSDYREWENMVYWCFHR